MATGYEIPMDSVYPRTAEFRYRVYARKGKALTILAVASDAGGVGQALVTLHDDMKAIGGKLGDYGRIGCLDVLGGADGKGDWILLPWDRS